MTTSYRLVFRKRARKAYDRLDSAVQKQLARKLAERLVHPKVQSAALRGMPDCYKIKLRAAGVRLVYRVEDDRLVLLVIAVGRRDEGEVFEMAFDELKRL